MQKLAAIVNCLTEDELANLSPHAALTMLKSVRDQPRGRDADAALKRLATHLLRDIPRLGEGVPLLH